MGCNAGQRGLPDHHNVYVADSIAALTVLWEVFASLALWSATQHPAPPCHRQRKVWLFVDLGRYVELTLMMLYAWGSNCALPSPSIMIWFEHRKGCRCWSARGGKPDASTKTP